MRSHVGEETETKTRSTAAAKQKKRPGTAGEAIFALMPLLCLYSSIVKGLDGEGAEVGC